MERPLSPFWYLPLVPWFDCGTFTFKVLFFDGDMISFFLPSTRMDGGETDCLSFAASLGLLLPRYRKVWLFTRLWNVFAVKVLSSTWSMTWAVLGGMEKARLWNWV